MIRKPLENKGVVVVGLRDKRRTGYLIWAKVIGIGNIFSLWKQPAFGDAATGFPAKWRLRNERRNSILIGRATWEIYFNQSEALPISRIKFLRSFLRRHLAGKPVVALPNIGCFLRPRNIATRHSGISLFNETCSGGTRVLTIRKKDYKTRWQRLI